MPNRRRHGTHEDRGALRPRKEIRALGPRSSGRLSAALRADGGTAVVAVQPAGCVPGAAKLERLSGIFRSATAPALAPDYFRDDDSCDRGRSGEIVLFVDTFNRYFERENIDAALAVLGAAGYRVEIAKPKATERPSILLWTHFLSVGKVGEARHEASRTL